MDLLIKSITGIAITVGLVLFYRQMHNKQVFWVRVGATLVMVGIFLFVVVPMLTSGSYEAVAGFIFAVGMAWAAAIIWVPAITGFLGGKLGGLIDGGDAEIEPKPYYSIVHGQRKKGRHYEALAEVRKQLTRFPADFEGQLLLAELQATDLNDLAGAEVTIDRLCTQKAQPPQNVAYALNQLADWHMKIHADREAAERCLRKIQSLFPEGEAATRAAQRIPRLGDYEQLLGKHDRKTIELKKGVENLGLLRGADNKLRAPEVDQEQEAEELVRQLEEHPQDSHARETLAVIYAQHYQRLDLAMEQLDLLIGQPNQKTKQVVGWLNLMADLQVQGGATLPEVKATLERIQTAFPDLAYSELARRRIEMLSFEMRRSQGNKTVALGTYDPADVFKKRAPED